MNFLDIRTVLFSYVITNAICAVVMGLLWRTNHKRSPELGFWLADFILQFVAVLLIALRGLLPDFISVLLGTPLVILGTLLLYIGLERYTGKPGAQLHNYILLGVVILAQAYFTFIHPSLEARNVLFSLGLLALGSQCAWLLLRRVGSAGTPAVRAVGAVFVLYGLVCVMRIIVDLAVPEGNDFLHSNLYDTLAVLIYQVLFIGLTFALLLMVNQRIFAQLESDIIERKRAEQQANQLAAIVQSSEDAIIGKSLDGIITSWNQGAEKIYGYVEDEVIGKPVTVLVPPGRVNEVLEILDKVRSGEPVQHYRAVRCTKDGREIQMSLAVSPIRDAEGKIVAVSTIGRDITGSIQAEQEIHRLNAELEQRVEERTRELRAAQEKLVRQERLAVLGQLAGGVGHELRNPLGVINNSIYYLRLVQPDADEKVKKYLGIIEQEVGNADKIINDLLGFGRANSVEREQVAVAGLVRQALERFPVPASVELALELPDDLPQVFADPRQMQQVLGNLTTNACQAMATHSSATGVVSQKNTGTMLQRSTTGVKSVSRLTISAACQKEMVAIAVKDTGAGITPENMSKLFEPLFTTRTRGIGLGLAVSRKLAEANGGSIQVQSELGQGSTFTVYLPVVGKGDMDE